MDLFDDHMDLQIRDFHVLGLRGLISSRLWLPWLRCAIGSSGGLVFFSCRRIPAAAAKASVEAACAPAAAAREEGILEGVEDDEFVVS